MNPVVNIIQWFPRIISEWSYAYLCQPSDEVTATEFLYECLKSVTITYDSGQGSNHNSLIFAQRSKNWQLNQTTISVLQNRNPKKAIIIVMTLNSSPPKLFEAPRDRPVSWPAAPWAKNHSSSMGIVRTDERFCSWSAAEWQMRKPACLRWEGNRPTLCE